MTDLAAWIRVLNVAALAAVMFAIGLDVSAQQLWAALRQVRPMLLGIVANFVLVPVVTVLLLHLFAAVPLVSVGFFILAVCPGAPVGPTFTGLARGNVPLATGAMVVLGALSAVIAPALITVHLQWLSPAKDLEFDCLAIVKILLVTQLLPLGFGLAVRSFAPRFSGAVAKPMSLFANVLLLVLVGLIVATEYTMLQSIRLRGWCGMVLLLVASLAIGWFCGGMQASNRRAMAATTGVRNAAVGLAIASANFPDTPAVTAVIAYGVLSIFGTLAFASLVGRRGDLPNVEAP